MSNIIKGSYNKENLPPLISVVRIINTIFSGSKQESIVVRLSESLLEQPAVLNLHLILAQDTSKQINDNVQLAIRNTIGELRVLYMYGPDVEIKLDFPSNDISFTIVDNEENASLIKLLTVAE